MRSSTKTSRALGMAFVLQFITSFSSGALLKAAWFVPDNMVETLARIANQPLLLRANILLDVLTALGVIFLGAMLFLTLRKQNEKLALTAMGFYFLEGALLAVSRMEAFSLLRIAQAYLTSGQPALLLTMAEVAYASMEFVGNTLHMLAFCTGALLFYFLLYKSASVPRWMSLWGLAALVPMLIGTLTQIFGYTLSFLFYVPYIPFELVIGIWLLVKGVGGGSAVEQ